MSTGPDFGIGTAEPVGTTAPEEQGPLSAYWGYLAGAAHHKGSAAIEPPAPADHEALIEQALDLAGIHQAVYLAYCLLAERELQ